MDKPASVFDREVEWRELDGFLSRTPHSARLGVVSGRRRQGKTYLLRALTEAMNGFYFTATEATSADSLREFGAALAEHTGVPAFEFSDWNSAIEALFRTVPSGVVVIDEFPYLMRAAPALPSIVQRALDPGGVAERNGTARLLLCGSAMSVMGKLLAGNAPLRGRSGLELIVRPFDYRTAAEFWRITDPVLALQTHAIVGGTPAYRSTFIDGDVPRGMPDFDHWVERTVLNPAVPLFREARYLLSDEAEIREPALYHSVLRAIAAGKTTRGGIANQVGRASGDLAHPLSVLEDSGLVEKQTDVFHARRSTFRITEPLIVFYEAIMSRQWTLLEQREAAQVWARAQPTFFSKVVGPHFEEICRQWTRLAGLDIFAELFTGVTSGSIADPAQRTQLELDVVVMASGMDGDANRVIAIGEAKWGVRMGMGHLSRLNRACELLAARGYDTAGTLLMCFSGVGFDEELRRATGRKLVLVDPERLYADF